MAFAQHTNDRRNPEVDPIVLGQFREADEGHIFEYADRASAPRNVGMAHGWATDFPHVVYVGRTGTDWRFAKVLKTVAYIVIDEDSEGRPITEKWYLRGHKEYDVAGL